MKLTVEKKETIEVEINTPCYRKLESFFSISYLKFDKENVISIINDMLTISDYNKYNSVKYSEYYNDSTEISKDEFIAAFDNLVNEYKSKI